MPTLRPERAGDVIPRAPDPRERYRVEFDRALESGAVDEKLLAKGKCEPWNRYLRGAELALRTQEEWELERLEEQHRVTLWLTSGPVSIEPSRQPLAPDSAIIFGGRMTEHSLLGELSVRGVITAALEFFERWADAPRTVAVHPRLWAQLNSEAAATRRYEQWPVRITMAEISTGDWLHVGDQRINAESIRRCFAHGATGWNSLEQLFGALGLQIRHAPEANAFDVRPSPIGNFIRAQRSTLDLIAGAHLVLGLQPDSGTTLRATAFIDNWPRVGPPCTSTQVAAYIATYMMLPNYEHLIEAAGREREQWMNWHGDDHAQHLQQHREVLDRHLREQATVRGTSRRRPR